VRTPFDVIIPFRLKFVPVVPRTNDSCTYTDDDGRRRWGLDASDGWHLFVSMVVVCNEEETFIRRDYIYRYQWRWRRTSMTAMLGRASETAT